jgi:hypothetical protein
MVLDHKDNTPPSTSHHINHLNTPRLVANASGTPVWKWEQTEPFGDNPPNDNPSGLAAFDFPLRFPGTVIQD